MEQLLCLFALFLVFCIRLLHRVAYDRWLRVRFRIDAAQTKTRTNADDSADEISRLLDSTESDGGRVTRSTYSPPTSTPSRKARVICSATALGYMVVTALAIKHSAEFGAALLLHSPRFMFGRGGMFVAAIMNLFRALSDRSPMATRELQADGLTLLMLPLILRAIRTPGTESSGALDLLLGPALGAACFLSVVIF
ncbi:hypothetical protein B0H13DRAFT_2348105 [Mycena leptocephala]|nr:hypothetical protein B0H13DRAFT_2348105 [Mycena leptocephala]